ncbi:hypothetical protein DL770_001377 [Monosporascus sp. CRB-9-2]|nr:hypothetical protein DL770_001377 [Monosporascus sp. CRB-9-2]
MSNFHRFRICLRPAFHPPSHLRSQCLRHEARRSFYHQPNQTGYYQKSKTRIIRDMALGSALTLGAFFAYSSYSYRKALKGLEAEADETRGVYKEFARRFAEAREAKDHDRLREATFEFSRRLLSMHGDAIFEAGPLPPYPEEDELHGKEKIPPEDTLMFVEKDEGRFITVAQVSVNLDLEELDSDWKRYIDGEVDVNPAHDKLGELLTRFEYQVEFWRKQEKLRGGELFVVFALRDKYWTFRYAYDPWDSVGITSFD